MAIIIGSRNVDIIGDDEDVSGDDIIITGRGADIIISGDGDDLIFSGSGDDMIDAGDGDDIVFAGSGNDTVDGGNGDDFIVGGRGDDILTDGAGNDILLGSSGSDSFTYNYNANIGYSDFFHGGSGVDNVTLQFTSSDLEQLATDLGYADGDAYLAALVDYFDNSGRFKDLSDFGFNLYLKKIEQLNIQVNANVIDGTDGDDQLEGTNTDDDINAGDGNDTINGNDGNDSIQGEGGDDTINGGSGNDVLSGGDGNDNITTGSGNDIVLGGEGDDIINIDSADGDNTVDGGSGSNTLNVGAGISTLSVANTAPQSVLSLLNGSSSTTTSTSIQTLNVNSAALQSVSLDLSDAGASLNSLQQINSAVAATLDLSMNLQNTIDFEGGVGDSVVSSGGAVIGTNNFNQYMLVNNDTVNLDRDVQTVMLMLDDSSPSAVNINLFGQSDGVVQVEGASEVNINNMEDGPGGANYEINFDSRTVTRLDNATAIEYGLIAALIAVAAISAMQAVANGGQIDTTFGKISDVLKKIDPDPAQDEGAPVAQGDEAPPASADEPEASSLVPVATELQVVTENYSFDAAQVNIDTVGSFGNRTVDTTGDLNIILGENTPGDNSITVNSAQSLVLNFEDSVVVPGQDIIEIDVDNFTATRLNNAVTVDWVVLTAAIVGLGLAVLSSVSGGTTTIADKVKTHLETAPGTFEEADLDLSGIEYELSDGDDSYTDKQFADRAITTNGGNDTLIFLQNNGNDTINDFEQGADVIDITAYGFTDVSQLNVAVSPNNSTLIDLDGTNSITLLGINGGLTNADFVGFTGVDPYTAFDDFVTLFAGEAVTFNVLTDEFNNANGADILGEIASITTFSSLPNPIVAGTELDEIFVRYLDANVMSDLQGFGYEVGATLVEGAIEGEFTYDSNFKYAHINSGNAVTEDALIYTASDGVTTDTANINIDINGTDVDQAVLNEGFGATLNGSANQDFYRVDASAFEWIINTGLGRDLITVEGDNNIIDAGGGADLVIVKGLADLADNPLDNATNNVVDGGAGDDILIAGRLSDGTQFNGGDGDDILIVGHASVLTSSLEGGLGEDILVGHNSVVDTFKINVTDDSMDFIDNFTTGQDKIDLTSFYPGGGPANIVWSLSPSDVAFKDGTVNGLTLNVEGVNVAIIDDQGLGLSDSDFLI